MLWEGQGPLLGGVLINDCLFTEALEDIYNAGKVKECSGMVTDVGVLGPSACWLMALLGVCANLYVCFMYHTYEVCEASQWQRLEIIKPMLFLIGCTQD